MEFIDQSEKTIIFCPTQVRSSRTDLINQLKTSTDPNYCVRVTANDGELGEKYLREFQDNERSIPTISLPRRNSQLVLMPEMFVISYC